jgi:site-specific recombinase XerD
MKKTEEQQLVSPLRGRRFPAEVLTNEEVSSLVRGCSSRAPTGVRNAALIAVLYRAGLRVSEALGLFPKDLDASLGTLRVLEGKGGKSRTVALDDAALALIGRWLDRRPGLGLKSSQRLFSTLQGTPMQASYIRELLPRLGRRAGIARRVHAHGLRHSFAAELMAEGAPINVISRALGHSSVATTARYLDHIAPQQVIDTLRSRHWAIDSSHEAKASLTSHVVD